jgi:hypothetical protein
MSQTPSYLQGANEPAILSELYERLSGVSLPNDSDLQLRIDNIIMVLRQNILPVESLPQLRQELSLILVELENAIREDTGSMPKKTPKVRDAETIFCYNLRKYLFSLYEKCVITA